MQVLADILTRNAGQVLTPELVTGILYAYHEALPEAVCSAMPGREAPDIALPEGLRHPRIVCDQERVGDWVAERVNRAGEWGSYKALGALSEDGDALVAGVVITDITNTNAFIHVAIEGRMTLKRAFLWAFFDYVFNQLDLERVTGLVRADNADALRFDKHLGFEVEGVIQRGADVDVLMLVMWRERCRWLRRA